MKNLLAFLVLLSHMNFTMFIPQVDEIDHCNAQGKQEDDINSLYEYIDQIVLGNQDDTPEDEDDDQSRTFNLSKIDQYPFSRLVVTIKNPSEFNLKNTYPLYLLKGLPSVFFEIQSPPPEA